jgi:hypothetical protein
MKTKIFNIVVYTMLSWSMLSAGYLALPVEYQEMIPQMNWLMAVVGGGSTLLLGSGGLAVNAYINKARIESNAKYNLLGNEFLKLADNYKEMKDEVTLLRSDMAINNKLLKIDLKTKLSNPLIDEAAKALVEGAIHEEE